MAKNDKEEAEEEEVEDEEEEKKEFPDKMRSWGVEESQASQIKGENKQKRKLRLNWTSESLKEV